MRRPGPEYLPDLVILRQRGGCLSGVAVHCRHPGREPDADYHDGGPHDPPFV